MGYIKRVRWVEHANVGNASMSKVRVSTPLVHALRSLAYGGIAAIQKAMQHPHGIKRCHACVRTTQSS